MMAQRVSGFMTQKIRMMSVFVGLGAVLILNACSAKETGKILGLERQKPDEFAVVTRAPLTLPPEFGLRPPDPDGQRTQDLEPQIEAQRAVFGDEAVQRRIQTEANLRQAGSSPGEIALLTRTGGIDADSSIRRVVDQESAALAAEQESFIDTLVFWRDAPVSGDVIDANEETRRLQGNAALGQGVTDGQSPIITREGEKSFFSWPF